MTIRNLDYLFEPQSVAVIGATESATSVAGVVTRNLIERFKGPLYPVNPRRKTVLGRRCLTGIEEAPEVPDLAVITSPADTVVEALTALGRRGVRACVIISDLKRGETPAADLRRMLIDIARAHDIRIAGPNCLGLSTPHNGLHAAMSRFNARPGPIAFVGQSATAAGPLVDWANLQGLGFSHVISLGDMIDVDYSDVLFYLAENTRCRSIVLYAERLPFARRFLSAARHAARTKPVIIMKAGTHGDDYLPEGAVIDPSLPDRHLIYGGAFRRAGLIQVRTLEALFDTVEALSARLPADSLPGTGDRLAILSNGESIGTMAMDSLLERGGRLATLAPDTVTRLSALLPPGRPRANPVDILPDADGARFRGALDVMMEDPNTDAILVLAGPTGVASGEETARAVAEAVETARRTPNRRRPWILTSWPGGAEAAAARRVFAEAHIPSFETPSTAIAAFSVLHNHRQVSIALRETPASLPALFNVDPAAARTRIAAAQAQGLSRLTPEDTGAVFAAYGLRPGPLGTDVASVPWRIRTAIDPEFGPLIVLGLAGPEGDLISPPAVGLPPLNQTLAQDVILSHRLGPSLFQRPGEGARLESLALALMQTSQMLVDLPDIVRLDMDGILVGPVRAAWTTAAIEITAEPLTAPDARNRLAIRPYPRELERHVTARDGRVVLLRPIRPEDEPALIDHFNRLSPEDVRRRFFRPIKTATHEFMAGLTQIDYEWHMAFVLAGPGLPGEAEIMGVVRLVRDHSGDIGEYAVVVRSDLQGLGLGRILMEHIIAYARTMGLNGIYGHVLAGNQGMLDLNRRLGFTIHREPGEPGVVRVELDLTAGDSA